MAEKSEYVTTSEATKLAKGVISQRTVIRYFDNKKFPGIRHGKIRWIHRESFLAFMRQQANGLDARALI